ncbi:MAG TPA: ferrochelatase, partial [Gammaproteobacteria bacterium]|nr:ferrochelatase [Gammaproteobacteria bacterium]
RDGATRLQVLPLYPQYAAATTASSFGAVTRALKRLGWSVPLHMIRDYHADPAYIAALAESVREHWRRRGRAPRLIISFHGIPQQVSDAGDPYAGQCAATAAALARELELAQGEWRMTFQSRFGPAAWLKPYTEDALREYASQGVKQVDVLCPGFAADCLETLEEISLRYAESFRAAGGEDFRYIPALNDRDSHVQALAGLLAAQLAGPG